MLERCTALRTHHELLYFHLKIICSERNCECSHNKVNVFERGVMLRGCSKVGLAVTTLLTAALYGQRDPWSLLQMCGEVI